MPSTSLRIDAVSNCLFRKFRDLVIQNHVDYRPNLAVYMDQDYYYGCVAEISGAVFEDALEFHDYGSIQGFPVYPVLPRQIRSGAVKHPPFVIVNLDA